MSTDDALKALRATGKQYFPVDDLEGLVGPDLYDVIHDEWLAPCPDDCEPTVRLRSEVEQMLVLEARRVHVATQQLLYRLFGDRGAIRPTPAEMEALLSALFRCRREMEEAAEGLLM